MKTPKVFVTLLRPLLLTDGSATVAVTHQPVDPELEPSASYHLTVELSLIAGPSIRAGQHRSVRPLLYIAPHQAPIGR
jgi:hypothetical protein